VRIEYPIIKADSQGIWYIWYDRHKRKSLKTSDKRIAAQALSKEKQKKVEGALFVPKKDLTLSAYVKDYLEIRKKEVASDTYDADKLALDHLVAAVGADKKLSKIDTHDIATLHTYLMTPRPYPTKTGKVIFKVASNTSCNTYDRHLRHAFVKAQEWGYIREHPYMSSVTKRKIKFLPEQPRPFREMTEEEIRRTLLPAIKDLSFRLMIQAYLLTAARGGEICNAHRDWIHEKEVMIQGKIERVRFLVLPETKTHVQHEIPISAELEEVLSQLPAEGYLFPKWRRVQTVSKKLRKILKNAGLDNMWLHGLRHDSSHKLSRRGVPLKVRMAYTNHKQVSTMLRYEHPTDEDLVRAADTLHFSPIISSDNATKAQQIADKTE